MSTDTETERTPREILERVTRVVEPYLDGMLITNYGIGNREYSEPDEVWVLGDWNPKRFPRGDDAPLTREENLGPRLAAALEYLGAELHWLDEWVQCEECWQIFRTQPDSYSWTMRGDISEHGVWCSECARDDIEEMIADRINEPTNAVLPWITASDLSELGFELFSGRNETGWHRGMDADPREEYARARKFHDEVLFRISEVSQFYSTWECWVRDATDEEETE